MADHRFFACPECGATVRDDRVETHDDWHTVLDQAIRTAAQSGAGALELEEWPAETDPLPDVAGL